MRCLWEISSAVAKGGSSQGDVHGTMEIQCSADEAYGVGLVQVEGFSGALSACRTTSSSISPAAKHTHIRHDTLAID